MSWTYSGDPANNSRDAVRFLIGDTDTADQLVTDEEISFAITQKGTGYGAAWMIAVALQAKFARQVTSSAGELSENATDRAKNFSDLATKLYGMMLSGAKPYFGGTSIADKMAADADTSRPQPSFERGQYDNPLAPQEDDLPSSRWPEGGFP